MKRFKGRSPFEGEPPRRKLPNIMPWSTHKDRDPMLPTWRKIELRKEREGFERYKHIYENKPGP